MAATSSNKVNKQKHKKARHLLLDELSVVEDKQDIFFQLMCDVHTGNICKKMIIIIPLCLCINVIVDCN